MQKRLQCWFPPELMSTREHLSMELDKPNPWHLRATCTGEGQDEVLLVCGHCTYPQVSCLEKEAQSATILLASASLQQSDGNTFSHLFRECHFTDELVNPLGVRKRRVAPLGNKYGARKSVLKLADHMRNNACYTNNPHYRGMHSCRARASACQREGLLKISASRITLRDLDGSVRQPW